MRQKKAILVGLSFLLFFVSSVHAAELAPPGTPQRKFQRGALNVFFSPVEISNELHKVKTKDTFIASWLPAFFKGSVLMVCRAVTGIYEIMTAPIPSPPHYEPVYPPEFSLQHLNLLEDES
jgi:putative exosortase-associated protein (TIGR04073 family)